MGVLPLGRQASSSVSTSSPIPIDLSLFIIARSDPERAGLTAPECLPVCLSCNSLGVPGRDRAVLYRSRLIGVRRASYSTSASGEERPNPCPLPGPLRYALSTGSSLHWVSTRSRDETRETMNPTAAWRIQRLGCTRRGVACTSTFVSSWARTSPSSVRADSASTARQQTASSWSASPMYMSGYIMERQDRPTKAATEGMCWKKAARICQSRLSLRNVIMWESMISLARCCPKNIHSCGSECRSRVFLTSCCGEESRCTESCWIDSLQYSVTDILHPIKRRTKLTENMLFLRYEYWCSYSVSCRALGSDDQRSRSFFNDRSEIGDHILQRDRIGDCDRFLPKISILNKFRSFSKW